MKFERIWESEYPVITADGLNFRQLMEAWEKDIEERKAIKNR